MFFENRHQLKLFLIFSNIVFAALPELCDISSSFDPKAVAQDIIQHMSQRAYHLAACCLETVAQSIQEVGIANLRRTLAAWVSACEGNV